MSTPNPPRTGLRPTQEFVPQGHYYPTVITADTAMEAARDTVYQDPDVRAHFDAYHGRADIQQSVIDEAAYELLASQTDTVKPTQHKPTHTIYVTTSEPLPFFWQRTNQLEANSTRINANPALYGAAVLKHIDRLSSKQLVDYHEVLHYVIEQCEEPLAEAIATELAKKASELGVNLQELGHAQTATILDLKRVA